MTPDSASTLAAVLLALLLALPATAPSAAGATENSPLQKERYEWFNIWWDCANDAELPRVLLIGDSICCGYSAPVTKLLAGKVHVDRLGTSRSINDPVLAAQTRLMLAEYRYQVIHFNNGLHGMHLSGPAYAAALRAYTKLLQEQAPRARLLWAASTPTTKSGDPQTLADNNQVVIERNALAAALMDELKIPVNDLYQIVVGKSNLRAADGYHYNSEGYAMLAKAVAQAIGKLLP